jgi:hypothetical protein
MVFTQTLKQTPLNKLKMGKSANKYYLDILLSNIDERIIEIESKYKSSSEKQIAYKTILEQISKLNKN